jgi:phosphoserine phosphatase RsbU/P
MSNSSHTSLPGQDPILGKILRDDLRRGDFKRTMRRDYAELKELFLDDHRRARLREMTPAKKWFYTAWWLLKALIRKLTPARRLLLVVALIAMLLPQTVEYSGDRLRLTIETGFLSVFILLFILMLELKDKLLAHDELEAGRAVQLALMPDHQPEIPGWSAWLFTRTANEVGGDLVDCQKMDPGRYRLSLADVAGKGLKAALLTAKLQATLRAIAPDTATLSALGERINKIFYRDSLRNTFASLVCVELHSDSDIATMMNAGHLPPIVIRGTAVEETGKGNPGIGILPEITCAEQQLELRHGDVLLLYSDGVTEAKNQAGQFYGSHRLFDLLPLIGNLGVEGIGNRIVQDVDRFVGEERVYDDLSLVVLKRMNIA